MGKLLTVILGAGASYDLVPPGMASVKKDYRPPLTKDLFAGDNDRFEDILTKYPDALNLAATIRVRMGRKEQEPLEAVLRSLTDDRNENIARQVRQIPLYLQELFGTVSELYTPLPVNYSYLVTKVLTSHFERVAFVTLNYDLLIEKAIEAFVGAPIRDLKSYVGTSEKWLLVKLHGSVNWVTSVRDGIGGHAKSHEGVLAAIRELPAIEGPLQFIHHHSQRRGGPNSKDILYPAIAVPVEGKYEFVCPDEHIVELQRFLASCEDFLVIGTSAKDRDLLELLRDGVKRGSNLAIVAGNLTDAQDTYRQIRNTVSQIGAAGATYGVDGFTGFVESGEIDKFISSLAPI